MYNLLITKIKKWKGAAWIALLLFIAIISHWNWFIFGNILTFGDTFFRPLSALKDLYLTNTWIGNFGFGSPEIQVYRLFFISIWSLGGNIGLQFTDALRITHLIPIAVLGFISPYLLIRHLTNEKAIAFVGAIFYGSTTPFIMRSYLGHLSIAFIIAVAPLILYFFILALKKNNFLQWLIFVLLYWVGVCYEPRIMYIVTIILGIYYIFFGVASLKKHILNLILAGVLIIFLNAFWIISLMAGGSSAEISSVAGRPLFGDTHYSMPYSIALFHDNWTGTQPIVFSHQPIPWYFWIIPAFTIIFFLFPTDKKNIKIITFFGIIWLIGLFLTKQVGEPLPGAFQWLRDNIPGFIAFRSGSKFWFVLSFGYMGLLSFGLLRLKTKWNQGSRRIIFTGASVMIIAISLWNLKPLIMGNIGGMFDNREIPKDYSILTEYLEQKKDSFRTFWVPSNSRWSYYSEQKPSISDIGIIETEWKNLFEKQNVNEKMIQNRIINIFKSQFSDNLFDNSSIKYVIVPTQDIANNDDFYPYYGGKDNQSIRNWYIAELDKIGWLNKIDIGTKELTVYINKNFKPHIYSDNGLNYSQTDITEFGDFSQNQNLYLNSDIEKNNYLINHLDNIIVPVEADFNKIKELKLTLDTTAQPELKKELQSALDLYASNLFFKDFKLKIPRQAVYKIYLKEDSLVAKNKNIGIKIDNNVLQNNPQISNKQGWRYFNQIQLDKGEHDFKLYTGNTQIDTINSGDIILSAENLSVPIKTPQLEYKKISPSKYIVNVYGAKESFPLIFSESFHPGWKIYVQPELISRETGQFISEESQGTIQNENLNNGNFYDFIFRKSILNNKHFKINSLANAWWIDTAELEQQKKVKKNNDGTYNFSINIEFEPQKYFYFGLFISELSLFACLSYLLYKFSFWIYKLNQPKNKGRIIQEEKNLRNITST